MATSGGIDVGEALDFAIELASIAAAHARYGDDSAYLREETETAYRALAETLNGWQPGAMETESAIATILGGPADESFIICDAKTRERVAAFDPQSSQGDAAILARYGLVALPRDEFDREESERQAAQRRRNAQATLARKAREGLRGEMFRLRIPVAHYIALRTYAPLHGARWKARLRVEGETGSTSPMLQWLRNHSCFGPNGLNKLRLPPRKAK